MKAAICEALAAGNINRPHDKVAEQFIELCRVTAWPANAPADPRNLCKATLRTESLRLYHTDMTKVQRPGD